MIKKVVGICVVALISIHFAFAQVDTSYVYRTGLPYGTLDIRLAKSSTRYYYLKEGETFSFRESSPGVKTKTYVDMTNGWDSSPYTQGNLREKNGSADYFVMNYRFLFPVSYNPTYSEGYPLIIMVHGLGERGNCWNADCYWADKYWKPLTNSPAAPTTPTSELLNNDHSLLHGGKPHLDARNLAGSKLPNDPTLAARAFPGFVLFPQNLNGWDGGSAQDVIRLIRLLVKKYNIDPNRIYIHGLSNGGAAVYDIMKRAPWLFACAAPMSAVSESGVISQNMLPAISSLPLWIFQGAQDVNPTQSKTEGYIKKFKEAGLSVRYTKYDNIGHATWNPAYKEPDFFTWLRSKHKSTIHVFADNPTLCTTTGEGVKMNLAEGFLAYQWERNGAIISGANSAYYTATTTGTYRARFSRKSRTPSEADWNDWSAPVTVTSSSPTKARITQSGTVVLKDLNYYNYANLSSVDKADHYYWYKDGALVNLAGSVDDTVRFAKMSAGDCSSGNCAGNGNYTLVTAGFNNCPSPASDPIHVYFNDQAPINITAPASFTGSGTSETTARLNWADASSNEGNFEVWRRKQTGTTYGKWAMATLVSANVTTLNDVGLEPGSTYQYKIRAVSSSGRSNYTPASGYLTLQTTSDTQIPTAPTNLVATNTAIQEITLTWNAATDNTGVKEYVIYYGSTSVATGSTKTKFELKGLALNTNYNFTVKARDLGGNLSGASNSASASTFVNGLYYTHTTGGFSDIDLIDWNIVEYKGKVDNFTLVPRVQEDYYNFRFTGYLNINTGGSYQFQVTSDDGSRVSLDNVMMVDNDGRHGTKTISGAIQTVNAGAHFLDVKYFDYEGGQNITVRYKGPDTGEAWLAIPSSALNSGTAPMSAASLGGPEAIIASREEPTLETSVYPNPVLSGQELSLKVSGDNVEPVHVSVVNVMGTSFFQKTFATEELSGDLSIIPQQALDQGIYIVVVKQGKNEVRTRIIVKD
jgi:hypothetical protein